MLGLDGFNWLEEFQLWAWLVLIFLFMQFIALNGIHAMLRRIMKEMGLRSGFFGRVESLSVDMPKKGASKHKKCAKCGRASHRSAERCEWTDCMAPLPAEPA